MPSLIELVEKINSGDSLEPHELSGYQESPNSAERFLAHHAGATLQLRACHTHLYEALKAINFADRKVLEQYVGLCGFLAEGLQVVVHSQFHAAAGERLEAGGSRIAADVDRQIQTVASVIDSAGERFRNSGAEAALWQERVVQPAHGSHVNLELALATARRLGA